MLTLPFLFKNALVEIIKYRWEKAAVIHKDLAQELEDCKYTSALQAGKESSRPQRGRHLTPIEVRRVKKS